MLQTVDADAKITVADSSEAEIPVCGSSCFSSSAADAAMDVEWEDLKTDAATTIVCGSSCSSSSAADAAMDAATDVDAAAKSHRKRQHYLFLKDALYACAGSHFGDRRFFVKNSYFVYDFRTSISVLFLLIYL